MEVLILAAGRGKRLKPLTDYIPKPLLPIEGKPVLQHIFEVLIECNLNKTGIVLGYLGKIIEKYISDNPVKNLELSYAYQEELLGSANAVKEGKSVISEDFLLIAADTVFQIRDVKKIIEMFEENDFEAVVGLKKVLIEELRERSTVRLDSNNFLMKVIEKPKPKEELSSISVVPIYAFRRSIIWDYIENVKPSSNGIYELATVLQNLIDDGKKVKGVFISSSRDITWPLDILKENFTYLKPYLKRGF